MDGRDPVGRTKVRLEKSVEAAERTRAWWGPSPAEERVWKGPRHGSGRKRHRRTRANVTVQWQETEKIPTVGFWFFFFWRKWLKCYFMDNILLVLHLSLCYYSVN